MIIKCTVEIGPAKYQFEIDEREELETLHKAIVFTNPRRKCNVCEDFGYKNKYFTTNKSSSKKGSFTFINVKCGKCGARSQLGQYKAGGYFWKDFEKYEGGNQEEPESQTTLPEEEE